MLPQSGVHSTELRHRQTNETQRRLQGFSCDLEMKTREQNINNKRTEIERFDWFIQRIQTRVVRVKKLHARELFRNKSIFRFDVIL